MKTMENKVYYGEYTLSHWIDLILTENIVLPEYQRYFVWDKDQAKALVKALEEKQFVPPVTIGSYINDGRKQNLILDGQQRLTSIFLTYLNLFPPKDTKRENAGFFANENDEENVDELDYLNWNFNQLLRLIKKNNLHEKDEIRKAAIEAGYEEIGDLVKGSFFEKCYLGFSFIVPATSDGKEQQKFYSKVFRSINIEGKKLLPLESREALYYLNKDLVGLFSPEFTKNIFVKDGKMDFVRYLSMLSQYAKNEGTDAIARGYSKNMEFYYENFIYAVVDETATKEFINLSEKLEDLKFDMRMNNLIRILSGMKLIKNYESIIDLDLYMFGAIYWTIFEGKDIRDELFGDLDKKIQAEITAMKGDELHHKNPSALKHLKLRIQKSIGVYEEYVS